MPCSISAFLSDCLQSVWHSLGPSMLLQMASFHSSVAEWYSIVYMYSVFFIHLSVGRHLGCFCVLGFSKQCCNEYWGMCIFSRFYAIVNNAAVSIRVLCIFWRYLHFLIWDFFFFCHTTRGIFIPQPVIVPPALEAQSLTTGPRKKSRSHKFYP